MSTVPVNIQSAVLSTQDKDASTLCPPAFVAMNVCDLEQRRENKEQLEGFVSPENRLR